MIPIEHNVAAEELMHQLVSISLLLLRGPFGTKHQVASFVSNARKEPPEANGQRIEHPTVFESRNCLSNACEQGPPGRNEKLPIRELTLKLTL
ncbi:MULTISPECIES: hypothetical protein [Bradyrhizobium]|uniref:hypothetical protein n=1 Tax=Bradyrhizobium TaxID=374 RepID=UPI00100901F8|nr:MULTISPECIES: hypothetical protein [Bradyrhizobium]